MLKTVEFFAGLWAIAAFAKADFEAGSRDRMSEAAKVTVEEVRRVAELANLELTADEESRMQRDLNAILGHVAQLNELDTSSVQAMAQVTEILALPPLPALETLRPDTVRALS